VTPLALALGLAAVGGAFGAAVGALPAFVLTGVLVVAGEAVPGLGPGFTADVAFGPVFGPHVSFAGGAAAAAFVARGDGGPLDGPAHPAKDITTPLGWRPPALAVGGAFGVVGLLVAEAARAAALSLDPVALGVVGSAVAHRVALGYPLLGDAPGGRFDVRGHRADGGRQAVEPWLPHQSRWRDVAAVGLVAGALSAALGYATASPFFAFGVAAVLLAPLVVDRAVPAAHHVALPASTGALAVADPTSLTPAAVAATPVGPALAAGTAFGLLGALLGELAQRVAYAHADTHLDPPAASIVLTTALVGVLAALGVLPTGVWVGG